MEASQVNPVGGRSEQGESRSANPEDTELASGTTIRHYRMLRQNGDTARIAGLIEQRLTERYFVPTIWSDNSHGFAIMAIACLMLESLESFRRGLSDSHRQSEALFCAFFQRENKFALFRPKAHEFYRHVRCGILHQGETTGGWRIQQRGLLLEESGTVHWVNALEFMLGLKESLDAYCASLKLAAPGDLIWRHAFSKLRAICRNSGVAELAEL